MDTTKKERAAGFVITCHACGETLPLLHPHIMVERQDIQGNLLCEDCYQANQQMESKKTENL